MIGYDGEISKLHLIFACEMRRGNACASDSSTYFPRTMRWLCALILILLGCSVQMRGATDWTVYQLDGRDYVTMENVAAFYGLPNLKRHEKEVTASSSARSLRGKEDSQELFINNLKFILSYPLVAHKGSVCISRMDLVKLLEPVMRPGKIKGADLVKTIILDAGHGGHDKGATSFFGTEQASTLDTAMRAKALLQAAGYKVVLTRGGDYFVPLDERVKIANQHKNALFISIHFNAGGWGTGVETYTLAPRGVPSMMSDGPAVTDLVECAGNAFDAQNIALATSAHASMVIKTRLFDRGLKRARFVVIRDVKMPGVLLEGGFMSNPADAKLIASSNYRQLLAQSILQAVENYRRAVGAPQPVRKSLDPPVHVPTESKNTDPPVVTSGD